MYIILTLIIIALLALFLIWISLSRRSSANNSEPNTDLCFFGDSITRGSNFQNDFPNMKICNLGLSGDNLYGMSKHIRMISSVNPKKIFIMGGINDLLQNKSISKTVTKYKCLVRDIENLCPDAEIYLQSILPINNKIYKTHLRPDSIIAVNEEIAKFAFDNGYNYINLFNFYSDDNNILPREYTPDGIHLYPEAYKKWSEVIHYILSPENVL